MILSASSLLCLALLHFLWQGAVAGALALPLGAIARRFSANAQYLVLCAGLVALPLAFAVTLIWLVQTSSVQPTAMIPDLRSAMMELADDEPLLFLLSADAVIEADEAPAPTALVWRVVPPVIAIVYLLAVATMSLRLLFGLCGARRLVRESAAIHDERMLDSVAEQCRRLSLFTVPVVAYCRDVAVPTVIGVLRPTILLPLAATTAMTTEEIETILTHELVHIRRLDHMFVLVQRLLEAAFFFHPAVWVLSRRISDVREHCCDDRVISLGIEPQVYVESLLRAAELSLFGPAVKPSSSLAIALSAVDQPSRLRERILRLVNQPMPTTFKLRPMALAVAIGLVLIAVATPLVVQSFAQPPAEISAEEKNAPPTNVNSDAGISTSQQPDEGSILLDGLNRLEVLDSVYTDDARLLIDWVQAPREGAGKFRGQLGSQFEIEVTGNATGNVWGTDVYTDDSDLGAAAVHAGLLKPGEKGTLVLTIVTSPAKHVGTSRNGVESRDYGTYGGSFMLHRTPQVGTLGASKSENADILAKELQRAQVAQAETEKLLKKTSDLKLMMIELGPKHPEVLRLTEEINHIRAYLDKLRDDLKTVRRPQTTAEDVSRAIRMLDRLTEEKWTELATEDAGKREARHNRTAVGDMKLATYYVADLVVTMTPTEARGDFEPLIKDIQANVFPKTWSAVGGPASIAGFPTNLSLVISHDHEGHQEIAKYLAAKRQTKAKSESGAVTHASQFLKELARSENVHINEHLAEIHRLNTTDCRTCHVPAPTNATSFRGKLGRQFDVEIVGSTEGSVWGTDIYTDDSHIATAAVHAGLVKAGEHATVTVTMVESPEEHVASERNGVKSSAWGAYPASYILMRKSQATRTRTRPASPTTASGFSGKLGRRFDVEIIGQTDGSVWGTDVYTDDSNIATAAVHAGLVKPNERAIVTLTIVESPEQHRGTTRNGVTTRDYGSFRSSFILQRSSQESSARSWNTIFGYRLDKDGGKSGPDLSPRKVQVWSPDGVPQADVHIVPPAPEVQADVRVTKTRKLPPGANALVLRGEFGSQFDVELTGRTTGSVWGSDVYTDDSDIPSAAVHAGLLKPGEKATITITIVKSPEQYVGSTQNGVTSAAWGQRHPSGYILQRKKESESNPMPPAARPAHPTY